MTSKDVKYEELRGRMEDGVGSAVLGSGQSAVHGICHLKQFLREDGREHRKHLNRVRRAQCRHTGAKSHGSHNAQPGGHMLPEQGRLRREEAAIWGGLAKMGVMTANG